MLARDAALVLLLLALWGCQSPVEVGLSRQRADALADQLDRLGIATRAVAESGRGDTAPGDGFALQVARGDAERALHALRRLQPEPPEPAPVQPLVPTPAQQRAALARATEHRLQTTLQQLPGVLTARVHLALPDLTRVPLDADPPPASASVLLLRAATEAPLDPAAPAALLASAVEGLSPQQVHVEQHPLPVGAPGPGYSWVGPFAVAPASARPLRMTLVAGLALDALLALGLTALVRRKRAPRRSR